MRIKKSFRKMLAVAIVAGTFAVMPLASAEVKEYEGFGEYVMSDFETPDVAKQRAKARAEQNAMEQAGVYVESYTKVINAQVTRDEITTMTNGILKVKDTQYRMAPTDDGKAFLIHATIKADIDTDDVSKWLEQNKKNLNMLVEQNIILQQAKEEQDRQIEELKKQLANVKTVQDKNIMQEKFTAADQQFLSNQKVEEGIRLGSNGDHVGAAIAFSRAVELNSRNANAYYNLGVCYAILNDEKKAIENFDKAVELVPMDARRYRIRGTAYWMLGDYAQAIANMTKAIELNPNEKMAYLFRGDSYLKTKDYVRAKADIERTLSLDPKEIMAYKDRVAIYLAFGDYTRAISDLSKIIEMDPNDVVAYHDRGAIFGELGEYSKAVSDLTKAIEIDFKNVAAYTARGTVYGRMGDYVQAIIDLTKVIELNPNDAWAYYTRGFSYQCLGNKEKAEDDFAMAKSLGYNP